MNERFVTLDSCVIGHAQNPSDKYFECASELIELLDQAENIWLIVDDDDLLFAEYDSEIGDPSYAREVLTAYIDRGKVRSISVRDLHADLRTFVRKRISKRKPRDRTLLAVALSHNDTLASDDFRDFPDSLRSEVRKRWGLAITDSCDTARALESCRGAPDSGSAQSAVNDR